jgi:hypothetical protein
VQVEALETNCPSADRGSPPWSCPSGGTSARARAGRAPPTPRAARPPSQM